MISFVLHQLPDSVTSKHLRVLGRPPIRTTPLLPGIDRHKTTVNPIITQQKPCDTLKNPMTLDCFQSFSHVFIFLTPFWPLFPLTLERRGDGVPMFGGGRGDGLRNGAYWVAVPSKCSGK